MYVYAKVKNDIVDTRSVLFINIQSNCSLRTLYLLQYLFLPVTRRNRNSQLIQMVY